MQQVGIVPSGCQVLYKGTILFFNEKCFCYASTLAVYIYNYKTFTLQKILSLNQRAITSITVSPHDENQLAISGLDGNICLWEIESEEILGKVAMNTAVIITWDPFSPDHIAVISSENGLKFYYW